MTHNRASSVTHVPIVEATTVQSNVVIKAKTSFPLITEQKRLPTPINPDRLEYWLDGYDPQLSAYLVQGFRQGFKLDYVGGPLISSESTLKSAKNDPRAVQAKLNKELLAGRIAGPLNTPPYKIFTYLHWGFVLRRFQASTE